MERQTVEILVLGSGFAGSLTALGCHRLGRDVLIVDRSKHPRFAIGESSTPVANRVLRDLAVRYDWPRILPLTQYGSWRQTYPEVTHGLKRGFSYFWHCPGQPFLPDADHANEMLVAASSDDRSSDTQWLRADVDQFLVREVEQAGVPVWEETVVEHCEPLPQGGWQLQVRRPVGSCVIDARCIVDGTGEAAFMPQRVGVPPTSNSLQTRSRSLFSHFRHVGSWTQWLRDRGAKVSDHPFDCDAAAQHMVLDGAWMWVLRFDNGVTSVGLAIDELRYPLDPSLSAEEEWRQWMERYPPVGEMLADAEIVAPPGRFIRTGRIQRKYQQASGRDWVALPHTAGFIDPLHSSGIAHSLCGVERLLNAIDRSWGTPSWSTERDLYGQTVLREVELIDLLVAGCYRTLGRFRLFTAWSMLYFAAATTYERRRATSGYERSLAFLNASDDAFVELVTRLFRQLEALPPTEEAERAFVRQMADEIAPYNRVGLFDSAARNMYHHTAAPEFEIRFSPP